MADEKEKLSKDLKADALAKISESLQKQKKTDALSVKQKEVLADQTEVSLNIKKAADTDISDKVLMKKKEELSIEEAVIEAIKEKEFKGAEMVFKEPATILKDPKPIDISVDANRDKESTKADLQKLAYLIGKIRDIKKAFIAEDEYEEEEETPEEESQNSFATHVYNEINSKIGGNNIEQFLCLLIPGIILNKEDYEFSGIKGPVIEANESRLANKMFDPCQMTNTDNGRTLPYQYKMALDMLTPKLNRKLALQKNKLRKLLMSKFPYDFGEGEEAQYTLLEVYSKLYDEYMDELYSWKMKLSAVKAELREEHPDDEDFENVYLKWYEDNAGDYLDKINEKKSKLLSVFSPNDMKILEGVLDSGSGAELQEARQNIYNLRKITPNGGYVYPVSFEPPNWFEMIGTSFTPAEIMDSPEKIAEKIQRLSLRRSALYSSICDLSPLIDKSFESTCNKIKSNKKIICSNLEGIFSKGIVIDNTKTPAAKLAKSGVKNELSVESKLRIASKAVLPALEIKMNSDVMLSKRSMTKLIDGALLKEKINISDEAVGKLNSLNDNLKANAEMQKETLNMSKKLTKDIVEFIETKTAIDKSMVRYLKMLKPLKDELDELDKEIEELNKLLNISTSVNENMSDDIVADDLLSPKTPKGFTKIEFEVEAESLDRNTNYITSSSTVTNGSGFLINGLGKRSMSKNESLSEMLKDTKCSKIHVCMNIAKVGIVREWFNPGVFFLTSNMYRLCSEKISPKDSSFKDIKERIKKMQNMVFPCYPVSLVLARDMQTRFKYNKDITEETRELFEKHANSNGGFLFFRGKDEYGNSDMAGVHTYFSDQTVTLKFDTTQVIGYYLQATAADKSTFIDEAGNDENNQNLSMTEFSENYRQMINDRQNKG